MSVTYAVWITREAVRANPDTIYLFGDNEQPTGLGGQAKYCRGEPNAVGIATKRHPSSNDGAFWSDDDFDRCAAILDADFAPVIDHARRGGKVVCARAGIGTGLSDLPRRAPRLMDYIRAKLREVQAASPTHQTGES